jgi:hypothetical protein
VLKKKREEKKRTEKKSFLFVWLILLNRVRLLHITHALVSTSSLSLSATVEGRVYCAFCRVLVFGVLFLCARKEIDTERETETEAAGEEIDRRRVQTDEENRSSCIGMMVAEEN